MSLNNIPPPMTSEKHNDSAITPEQPSEELEALSRSVTQLSIFDKVPDFQIDETMELKIINLKLTQFTHRRKDDLFKRHKQEQEKDYYSRISQFKEGFPQSLNLQGRYKLNKTEFNLRNQVLGRVETFPFRPEDMEKLRPDTDLNDTIISNYLKIYEFVFLPENLEKKVFFCSSFLMERLIPEYLKQENVSQKELSALNLSVARKVR